jgi:glycosyltransferase involved in cell wall biosynthesis
MTQSYTVNSFDQLPLIKGKSYWVWLASWYPSKTTPTNGDFIQRHAVSVAKHHDLIVIHCIHDANALKPIYYTFSEQEKLIEVFIYFSHYGNINGLKNKLVYNYLFYSSIVNFTNKLFDKIAVPRFIHVHVPMKMGVVARWIKVKWKIPYLVSEQSSTYILTKPDSFDKRSVLFKFQVKKVFQNAIAVTNVSRAVGEILKKIFSLNEVLVIHNQADINVFKYKEVEKPIFRFIHISTMGYQKNFSSIISTFEKLGQIRKDFELVLVGDTSEEASRMIFNASKIFSIKAVGLLNNNDVALQLQQSHCMVLFSRSENFPCVIVESLCCGIPVITSDVGGAAEAINESNGIVVQSEDELSLFSALQNIMTNYNLYNPKQIAFEAAKLYSGSNIANKFIEIYKKFAFV